MLSSGRATLLGYYAQLWALDKFLLLSLKKANTLPALKKILRSAFRRYVAGTPRWLDVCIRRQPYAAIEREYFDVGEGICKAGIIVALIGLVSDSHGEWLRTRNAMELLRSKHCERILYMGDVETHEVLDALAGNCVSMVFGNCDYVSRLNDYAVTLGLDVKHPAGVVLLSMKNVSRFCMEMTI